LTAIPTAGIALARRTRPIITPVPPATVVGEQAIGAIGLQVGRAGPGRLRLTQWGWEMANGQTGPDPRTVRTVGPALEVPRELDEAPIVFWMGLEEVRQWCAAHRPGRPLRLRPWVFVNGRRVRSRKTLDLDTAHVAVARKLAPTISGSIMIRDGQTEFVVRNDSGRWARRLEVVLVRDPGVPPEAPERLASYRWFAAGREEAFPHRTRDGWWYRVCWRAGRGWRSRYRRPAVRELRVKAG
jgi:hypothetical protein